MPRPRIAPNVTPSALERGGGRRARAALGAVAVALALGCGGAGPNAKLAPSARAIVASGESTCGGNVAEIGAGYSHVCARCSDGAVLCSGDNGGGAVTGTPSPDARKPPSRVPGVRASRLAIGPSQSCAIVEGGRVRCWGGGRPLADIAGLEAVDAVSVGASGGCALRGGRVLCWGGAGRAAPVAGLEQVRAVSVGVKRACAVGASGDVRCWEGDGRPELVPGVTDAVALAVSAIAYEVPVPDTSNAQYEHACAVRRGGGVVCWGHGWEGQLGVADPNAKIAEVPGVHDAVEVGARGATSCARLRSGGVTCWGMGTLGDGTRREKSPPVAVFDLHDAAQLSLGGAACVVTTAGGARCWGDSFGQLGVDGPRGRAPVTVPGLVLGPNDQLSAGEAFACALVAGRTQCWGELPVELFGERQSSLPRALAHAPVARAIATGVSGTCLLDAGGATCWGSAPGLWYPPALRHIDAPGAVAVAAGENHGCAATPAGLRCTRIVEPVATPPDVTDARALVAGAGFTCALRANGQVVCTGLESPPLTGVRAIASGRFQVCALTSDARVACWGGYDDQQQPVPTPRDKPELAGAVAFDAEDAVCGIDAKGGLHCVPAKWQPVGLPPVRAVALSRQGRGCAVARDGGQVHCWALEDNDRDPRGAGIARFTPTDLPL